MFRIGSVVGRLLMAQLFLGASFTMLTQPERVLQLIASRGMPFPGATLLAAIFLQAAGGTALLAGWQTRASAIGLAAFVLVATSTFHADFSAPDQMDLFGKDVAVIGGLITLAIAGTGQFSLDALIATRRSRNPSSSSGSAVPAPVR